MARATPLGPPSVGSTVGVAVALVHKRGRETPLTVPNPTLDPPTFAPRASLLVAPGGSARRIALPPTNRTACRRPAASVAQPTIWVAVPLFAWLCVPPASKPSSVSQKPGNVAGAGGEPP